MDPSKPHIVTFPLDRRPRATRASGSKVRTGCITCKKRHVKCDEAKPHCMRCLKSKGNCEGYERRTPDPPTAKKLIPKPLTPTPSLSPEPRTSAIETKGNGRLPSPQIQTTQPSQIYLESVPFSALSQPPFPQPQDEKEKTYFDQWLVISRSMTGGLVPADFWAKAIPQSSYCEKAVKSAVLAVGALSSALMTNTGPEPLTKEELYKIPSYTDALTYHADALRLVRQATSHDGVRIAVVCCILFFVYAGMAEEEETALRHLIHGTMILEQFINSQFGTSFNMLVQQQPASAYSSTAAFYFQVEDEIFQVFNRIAYHFLVHKYLLQSRMSVPAGEIFLHQPVMKPAHEIPSVFDNLVQARRWWDVLLARAGDSARERLNWSAQFPYPDWVIKPDVITIDAGGGGGVGKRHHSGQHRHNQDNQSIMEAWHSAFGPLYQSACDTQQERFDDFIRAIYLEVQFLTHRASVRCFTTPDYDTVASLNRDFGDIVRLLGIVLHFQIPSFVAHDAVFTIDMGHVVSLHLVATMCRDSALRQRAIGLLEKYPRRDGLWDSRGVVSMARLGQVVEQENLADGTTEEQWDRLKHREMSMDCSRHTSTLKALRRDVGSGIWILRTETIGW
ncbi:hypothetical protein MKZ38_007525 [Zalerion maritima]|uniref:Zn(2)-C6 fungal-type domain-containing protein n=1 Tax=Zalerion maritima TaxID=339359 RepID=A0AAD5WPR2_9PEZI|nr:hypothetical protein MKZ38_007525 [Zalerion maritima]